MMQLLRFTSYAYCNEVLFRSSKSALVSIFHQFRLRFCAVRGSFLKNLASRNTVLFFFFFVERKLF